MFVDENKSELALADTWHTLSLNQLLDAKSKLLDKIYMARGKPAYTKPLNDALAKLEVLVDQKMNDPRT